METFICFQNDSWLIQFSRKWFAILLVCFSCLSLGFQAQAENTTPQTSLDVPALQGMYKDYFENPDELIVKIDNVIESLDASEPIETHIRLDLWRLKTLTDYTDTRISSDYAKELYAKYNRESYDSKILYGETMGEIIQALTKTLDLDLCFEIIENLRATTYEAPSVSLDLLIDKSLMEIYIETFDYQRALNIELSILENPNYAALESYKAWEPSLYNEVAFLYNQIGDGENARKYLDYAKAAYQTLDLLPHKRLKAEANNDGNRGRAYLLEGLYDEAGDMGVKVLEAGKLLDQKYVIALGYRLIGSAALNNEDYEKAKLTLEKGIELADEYHISTMQKSLYRDYVKVLEKSEIYTAAYEWQKKLFTLEMEAQVTVANSREALMLAENRAEHHHHEIMDLKEENEIQRLLSVREKSINRLLVTVIALLLIVAAVLGTLFFWYRRNQKILILSEKNARHANQKAQEANRAKSEFLANMSHEIRTPMNGVLGMTQVLQKTSLTGQQKQYTDIILESGNNLMKLIGDILDLSKIESGKLMINPEPCNLEVVINDIINLFNASANAKNLNLNYDYSSNIPKHFNADRYRIRQVVTNLVGNAIKFTHEGEININVTGQVIGDVTHIKIDVLDTGIGIQADKLESVFEKFTQAEGSTTRHYGGSGLGLTISRNLVEAMGGALNVKSELGQGTVFTLILPLEAVGGVVPVKAMEDTKSCKEETRKNISNNSESTPECQASMSGRKLKFLIAKDNRENETGFIDYLQHPRISITSVQDGVEAVNAYSLNEYDMIFVDESMPEMGGVKAAELIRKHESKHERAYTPIICFVTNKDEISRQNYINKGIDECLEKPVAKQELLGLISKWLKRDQASRSTRSIQRSVG